MAIYNRQSEQKSPSKERERDPRHQSFCAFSQDACNVSLKRTREHYSLFCLYTQQFLLSLAVALRNNIDTSTRQTERHTK